MSLRNWIFGLPFGGFPPQRADWSEAMGEVRRSGAKKAAGEVRAPKPLGRKRDQGRDQELLEATVEILAEVGFDSMTMDLVAARAKAGKATLYRRWSSKEELVRDALIGMSRASIELDRLPDTGSLRGDLLALMKPYSLEHSERKLRVLAGLGSFSTQHPKYYDEALAGIFEPWTEVNRKLMKRAVERKELPAGAEIEAVCEMIVAMTAFRTSVQRKQFDREVYEGLLDRVLLPALRGGG